MATYNEIIFDTLETLRNNYISDDTLISESQILYHWDNQRALWLYNELGKPGIQIDPSLEQDLGCLELEEVDAASCCNITTECTALRTKLKLPKFINLQTGPAITRVGPVNKIKIPFNFTNYNKAMYISFGKYSKGLYGFLLNGYIYVISETSNLPLLTNINVRGILESPSDIEQFKCNSDPCFSLDEEYPLITRLIPYMKEEVIKQFLISMRIPKDNNNNGKEDLTEQ